MGLNRLSIGDVLDRVSRKFDVSKIYVSLDPISLSVAGRIHAKERISYFRSGDELLLGILTNAGRSIAIVAPRLMDVGAYITCLRSIVNILEQNVNKSVLVVVLCANWRVFSSFVSMSVVSNLPICIPGSLSSIGLMGAYALSEPKLSVLVVEPGLISLEELDEELDLEGVEGLCRAGGTEVRVGSGRVAVLAGGSVVNMLLEALETLSEDISIYALTSIDGDLRDRISSIVKEHANIVIVGLGGVFEDMVRAIAEKCLEDGQISRIPNITSVDSILGDGHAMSRDSLLATILDILGRGRSDLSRSPKISSIVTVEANEEIRSLMDKARRAMDIDSIFVIRPMHLGYGEHLEEAYEACVRVSSAGLNRLIILAHITEVCRSRGAIEWLLENTERIILVLSTCHTPEHLKRELCKEISAIAPPGTSIITVEEFLPERRRGRSRLIIVA